MKQTPQQLEEFFIDYSSLDDFQRRIIDRKIDTSMVVTGHAGSGKSLIALHKAKQVAELGRSYVVVVYTKTLKKYFGDGLQALGLENVYNYHQWRKVKRNVEYMIVDECQDFTHDEIEEMRRYGNVCFFFGDVAQSIMNFQDRQTQSPQETAKALGISKEELESNFNLYRNYRLTRQVASLAEKVGNVPNFADDCMRDGEKPLLLEAASFDAQLDKIAQIITNKSLTSVGILLPHNKTEKGQMSVEYVKDYLRNKGITCEFKYSADQETAMDLDFHSSNPKIMTWWCAKGLQFKDVFIPGCDYNFGECRRAALYVAMTRCCEHLYLGYQGSLCSLLPPKTSSVYSNSGTINMI